MTDVPLPPDDLLRAPARLDALHRTDLLDSPVEEAFDRCTRLVARALDVPVALLSLVDDRRQFFKSSSGLAQPWASARGTPLSHSFCQHVVAGDAPLRVADARTDRRVSDNPAVEEMSVRAYLGAPVHGPGGEPIGALCAVDARPRAWTDADLVLLLDLAEVASELIAVRTAAAERHAGVLDLSHRLRTGMTVLGLEAEEAAAGLPAGGPSARLQRVADGLVEQSKALGQALRRLEESGVDGHQLVDVVAVLAAVAAEATAATTTGRTVVTSGQPGGPVPLVTSSADLSRVLRGIVDLLLEHGRGAVVLDVLPSGTSVRVRVHDDSAGLPPDVARAVTARSDGDGDHGRLSLAERTARSLGGRLLLAGGVPTTVDVLLPRRDRY